jgi:hypothetical protein
MGYRTTATNAIMKLMFARATLISTILGAKPITPKTTTENKK